MDELSSRMEGTEEGISELKDGMITINNLNSRENRLKKRKTEQNLGDLCDDDETANSDVIRSPEEREEGTGLTTHSNNGGKLPNFGQRRKPTDSRSCINHKQDESKEIHGKMHNI